MSNEANALYTNTHPHKPFNSCKMSLQQTVLDSYYTHIPWTICWVRTCVRKLKTTGDSPAQGHTHLWWQLPHTDRVWIVDCHWVHSSQHYILGCVCVCLKQVSIHKYCTHRVGGWDSVSTVPTTDSVECSHTTLDNTPLNTPTLLIGCLAS